MKRLYLAATAAFLISAGAGVARAYYFTDCVFALVTQGGIAAFNTSKKFDVSETGNCTSGTVGCCVKIVSDLDKSVDGGVTWTAVSHQEDTFTYACGTNSDTPSQTVQAASGLYRLTSKIETCAGVVLHNFGTNTHQFP